MKNWFFIAIGLCIIAGGVIVVFMLKNDVVSTDTSQNTSTQSNTDTPMKTGTKSVTVVIADDKTLSTFSSALKTASIDTTLDGTGPYTVLAPTNDAFKALPAGTLDMLLKPENVEKLRRVLNYHIISGAYSKSQLTNNQRLKTINGQELTLLIDGNTITFVDAKGGKAVVKKADMSATNGVVHTVSAVVFPQ